jgi:hypothetical protein
MPDYGLQPFARPTQFRDRRGRAALTFGLLNILQRDRAKRRTRRELLRNALATLSGGGSSPRLALDRAASRALRASASVTVGY